MVMRIAARAYCGRILVDLMIICGWATFGGTAGSGATMITQSKVSFDEIVDIVGRHSPEEQSDTVTLQH